MSYPYCIQTLVIEDEPQVKALYETILAGLGAVPPKFAFCYEDAIEQLRSSTVFHLVLLDLRLPKVAGLPAQESVDLGLELLEECVKREWYPIPALLIVSGHIGKANQTALNEKVREGFSYGHVLVKGSDPTLLKAEIEKAVEAIKRYIGVGVHLRDAGRQTYPVISPREEDLLRRSVLGYQGGVGLDIEWWSANRFSNQQEPDGEWTKVLMGRFMLGEGDRPSRPHFFKLYRSLSRVSTVSAARGLSSKLQHVSVVADTSGLTRSLLVTQAVGPGDRRPVSLGHWLSQSASSADEIRSVAAQILHQIGQMGATSPDMQPPHKFFWPHHNDERLRQEWLKHGHTQLVGMAGDDPLATMQEIRAIATDLRYTDQTFVHGDLHAENVAVDVGEPGDDARAFIFDAGATSRAPRLKDVATLEVSVLLHADNAMRQDTLDSLYESKEPGRDASAPLAFLLALRAGCMPAGDPQWPIYALLVFDQALVQLGGLAFGISANKVCNPQDAARLAALAARWVRKLLVN
jgi:CheY-like chemotaxis protein